MNAQVDDPDWQDKSEEIGSREADDEEHLYESRKSPPESFHRDRNNIIQSVNIF